VKWCQGIAEGSHHQKIGCQFVKKIVALTITLCFPTYKIGKKGGSQQPMYLPKGSELLSRNNQWKALFHKIAEHLNALNKPLMRLYFTNLGRNQ